MLGANGAQLPKVLGTMATAYEGDGIEEALSARLRAMVLQWRTADQAMLEGASASLQPSHREKIVRMVTA